MKKLIIYITILSVMNFIGCYYQEQMNPSDYTFDENSSIEITTIDTVYNFTGDDYHLGNDTLICRVSKNIDKKRTLIYNVEIPLEDMEEVEVKRTDVLLTILLSVGILAMLIVALIPGEGGTTTHRGPPNAFTK